IDDNLRRGRIAQHRQHCNRRIVAAGLVHCGVATSGDQVQDDIRAKGFLAADLKSAITACSCLGQLPGLSRTSAPKSDGGICERITARLDLPLDTNGGLLLRESLCARRRDADKPRKQTVLDGPDSANGLSLPMVSAKNSPPPPGIARQRAQSRTRDDVTEPRR